MTIRNCLGILFFLLATPAFAENAKDAIEAFGLVGTWSFNCSADVTKEVAVRLIFEAPFFGAPRIVMIARDESGISGTKTVQILEAVKITEDKIKLVHDVVDITISTGEKMDDSLFFKGVEEVYQMESSKLRLFEVITSAPGQPVIRNGTIDGVPMHPLEKCLN
jgi:hypothetical protein